MPHALRPRAAAIATNGAANGTAIQVPVFPLYGEASGKVADLNLRIERRGDGTILEIRSRAKDDAEKTPLRGYLLDLSAEKGAIQALQLDWKAASPSFIGTIDVEASDDLAGWTGLAQNAALARLTFDGHRVERNVVELRAAKFKYLRISWPDSQAPLESLSVRALPAPTRVPSPRVWQRVEGAAVGGKAGDYSYDLGGYFPFDRLRVQLPQVNSLAQLQVLSRARADDEWHLATNATVYRLRDRDMEVNSPDIMVVSYGERHWLVRVDQKGGGLGSGVPALAIGWVAQKLVFAARGAGPFQLAYGGAKAKPNAMAIESLIPGYRTDAEFKVQQASLGEQVTLAGAGKLRAPIDYKKWALWGCLIFAVLLLGWMAWRLSRQIAKASSPAKTDKTK